MVGDIVLICDNKRIARKQQRLRNLQELIIGKDGDIQGTKLVIVSKSGSGSICYRPIKKIGLF